MTIAYPDVASYQGNIPIQPNTVAVCSKATESTNYKNPYYDSVKASANNQGSVFFAYHFLHEGNAVAQAHYCYSVVGSKICLMLDWEPIKDKNGNYLSKPSVSDADQFVTTYISLGGKIHLNYFPLWYWNELGKPNLTPALLKLGLVSSDYVPYSDNGPGWNPYAGYSKVEVWQWTSTFQYSGQPVDFNAYKGTIDQFKQLLGYSTVTPTPTPIPFESEDENMLLVQVGSDPNGEPGNNPGIYLLSGLMYAPILDPTDAQAFIDSGVKEIDISFAQHQAFLEARNYLTLTPDEIKALGAAIGSGSFPKNFSGTLS